MGWLDGDGGRRSAVVRFASSRWLAAGRGVLVRVTELIAPDCRLRESWASATAEFVARGEVMHGSGWWELDSLDTTDEGCRQLVARLRSLGDPGTVLPEDRVHSDYYWIVDGDEFVGYLALRHALNEWLLTDGGHIGFSVRPSRRREGHASRALTLSLPRARELGLARVLLTCDEGNVGSRLTIERNGGVHQDSRNGKRRYWIEL